MGRREPHAELLHVQRIELHVPRSHPERRDVDARHRLRIRSFAPGQHGTLVGQGQRRRVIRPVRLVHEPEPALAAHVLEGHARLHVVTHEHVPDVERLVQGETRRMPPRAALHPELARLRDDRDEILVVRQRIGFKSHRRPRRVARRQQTVVAGVLELGDAEVFRRRRQDPQPPAQRRLVPNRQPHLVRLPELELVKLDHVGLDDEHGGRVDRRPDLLGQRTVQRRRNLGVARVAKVRLLLAHTFDDARLQVHLPRGHPPPELP